MTVILFSASRGYRVERYTIGKSSLVHTFNLTRMVNNPLVIVGSYSSRTPFLLLTAPTWPHAPKGGTPLYGLYRYVRPQRVWFFSRFGHKWGINFSHFAATLVINRVLIFAV